MSTRVPYPFSMLSNWGCHYTKSTPQRWWPWSRIFAVLLLSEVQVFLLSWCDRFLFQMSEESSGFFEVKDFLPGDESAAPISGMQLTLDCAG